MVKEANVKQAAAEKQLKEAQGKVSVFSSLLALSFRMVINLKCESLRCK